MASKNLDRMIITTKPEWDAILSSGAVIEYETKYCKIFRMPDGQLWRAMPRYRMAWKIFVDPNLKLW